MDNPDPRSPTPELPAPADPHAAALEEHGYDLNDVTWYPVRRKRRTDGWSIQRQRQFIEMLADCGSVPTACQLIGMSVSGAYRLRRSPGGEAFAAAWDTAVHHAAAHLVDAAFERAITGSDEPVFDRNGNVVGRRFRQSDRLLMFLLRAHRPELYAHAHLAQRPADAPPPPEVPPLEQALAALAPEMPAEPHRLMTPDDLIAEMQIADMMDGEIPRWLRDNDGRADYDDAPDPGLGARFERELEKAKGHRPAPRDEADDTDDPAYL